MNEFIGVTDVMLEVSLQHGSFEYIVVGISFLLLSCAVIVAIFVANRMGKIILAHNELIRQQNNIFLENAERLEQENNIALYKQRFAVYKDFRTLNFFYLYLSRDREYEKYKFRNLLDLDKSRFLFSKNIKNIPDTNKREIAFYFALEINEICDRLCEVSFLFSSNDETNTKLELVIDSYAMLVTSMCLPSITKDDYLHRREGFITKANAFGIEKFLEDLERQVKLSKPKDHLNTD